MNISLSTDTLKGYGLNRIFELAKKCGFDGIDLDIDLRSVDTQNASYLNDLQKKSGLPIVAITAPDGINHKKILELIRLTKDIGCKILILQSPKIFDVKLISWYHNEIPKLRKTEDISIALENSNSSTLLGFIPEHALNNLGELQKFKHACLATDRVVEKKEDLIITTKKLLKFLVHIHLSNVNKGRGGQLPEIGNLPMESFLTKIVQDGYKGGMSIRASSKYLPIGNDDEIIAKLSHSIEYCRKYLEK